MSEPTAPAASASPSVPRPRLRRPRLPGRGAARARTDAPGTTGGPAPSSTLRELNRRRLALLVLVVLTTLALHQAFQGVHADARPMRTADAPGVLAVDTVIDALAKAQQDIADGSGTSRDFRTRISVANQSLARAAAADVKGQEGRLSIQTVTGLISTYLSWNEDANAQPAGSVLRQAYESYAKSMLGTDKTEKKAPPDAATIMGRLRYLQSQQQAVVARHSDFGWLLWAEWGAAVVLALATLWRLAEAARFSSARFRRRWSPPLTAGFLLLAGGTATLIAFTALTHAALADTRDLLAPALTGDDITHAGRRVSARLAGTGFRAAAAGWTLAGGLALAALVLLGLQPRINEYRVKVTTLRWPRPRTLAAAGLSLALLAGIGVVAVQATGWRGSVTLLANWTGAQEEKFRSDVIEPFQKDRRIRVIYEGSSAESEVLDADVESGTPPDVAVLPGPGELAGYAAKGLLTSLDDVVGASGFAATWVPKVDGHAYWVPIKADLKSMVWFPAARKDEVAADAKDPADWCLGLADGATSGWPGSDWIEDILLQQSGKDVYQQWASGQLSWTDPRVRRAWTTWAGLVSTGGEKAGPALSTAFADAADGVGANPPACRLEHQSSIVPSLAGWSGTTPSFVPSARVIPGAQGGPERWEVSGDLAAVLHDTPASHELISYLASETGQRAWAGTQSGFSVRSSELARDAQGTSTNARIAQALRDPSAVHCFDASDAMPESVRDEFAGAVLRYLAEPAELDGLLANLDHVRMKARTKGDTGLADVCTGGTG